MRSDPVFRRNLIIIAVAHLVVLLAFFLVTQFNPRQKSNEIVWLTEPVIAAIEPPDQPQVEKRPTPEETLNLASAPSEIVMATPTPTPTPAPTATATATPTATPKPTPKPTPMPKATPTPPPKPKTTPSPKASPTPAPKSTPTATPKAAAPTPAESAEAASAKQTFLQSSGAQKGASGSGESDFGWYHSMIHDRFYSRWDQPTSIIVSEQKFAATIRIRIERDGRISDVQVARSSGNPIMDESVLTAARTVKRIDPLPAGLASDYYEVNIEFELNQKR